MESYLINNRGFKWFNNSNVQARGYLVSTDGCTYKDEKLLNYFKDVENKTDLLKKIENSNGNFSCIIECKNETYVVVDHIRSFPIFYIYKQNHLIISDQPYSFKEKALDLTIEKNSLYEYLITGYVTGGDTIYKEIKQLRAGEYLVYNKTSKKIQVERYFNPNLNDINSTVNQDVLYNKLSNILDNIFGELINSLDGRTVALPLSGGYDSRLVALYFKKMGYKNIICYTYGKKKCTETRISKEVADYLGYEWYFIPHHRKKLYYKFNSDLSDKYRRFANNLSVIPHIQDWYAVGELKEKGILHDNSIFIPGHTAFLSFQGLQTDNFNKINAEDFIFNKHYSLWNMDAYNDSILEDYKTKIKQELTNFKNTKGHDLLNEIYFWEWQERHAKFICNSVRVYEFYNFEWRMPLWDKRLIEFWSGLSNDNKISKRLFKDFMKINFNIPVTQANPNRNLIIKVRDKVGDFTSLGRYNGNLNILSALFLKNKDISEHVSNISFINQNNLILLEKGNGLAALSGLNDLLD